jgi:hypothetical protein
MFNPLLPDLGKFKDQEIEDKILDLSRKYHTALRLGNGSVAQQIVLNLEAFKIEQHQRQAKSLAEIQNKQKKQGLDDLINVD